MGDAARRIFLAEDNDVVAALVERSLGARGWKVVRASTSAEARARLQGDRFDAVVLDYLLPDGDGIDLLRVVREQAPATPVLFLTAHGSEDVALRALQLGASDYMQKSAELHDELPERIESLFARESDVQQAARVVAVRPPLRARAAAAPIDADTAKKLVEDAVRGDVLGAAIFDGAGTPTAALLPDGMDAAVLGASLFQVHAQVGVVGRLNRLAPRGYRFTMDVDGATLASTTVSGRAIAAVLVRSAEDAADRLDMLAKRLR